MNLPDGVTREQWEELCVRRGEWKRGQRCERDWKHSGPEKWDGQGRCHCGLSFIYVPDYPPKFAPPHDIPCPPVTDERLMQVLRAGLERNASFLKEVHIQLYRQYSPTDPAAAIIRAYLALPKE